MANARKIFCRFDGKIIERFSMFKHSNVMRIIFSLLVYQIKATGNEYTNANDCFGLFCTGHSKQFQLREMLHIRSTIDLCIELLV